MSPCKSIRPPRTDTSETKMDKRRRPSTSNTSGIPSPVVCDRDGFSHCSPQIASRTFSLVTDWQVIPYYLLAIWYSFWYAPTSYPPPEATEYCIVKVLPIFYLLELVRHSPSPACETHSSFCRYILMGIAVCGVADAMMVWSEDLLYHSVALFCVGHLFYTAAFYQHYKGSFYSRAIFPLNLLICIGLIYIAEPVLPAATIVIYTLFITVMGFFALSRLEMNKTAPAYLGWTGVNLFIVSDLMLAINDFAPQFDRPVSESIVMMSYYFAQLAIGLSVYSC